MATSKKPNINLIKQAVLAKQANQRQATSATKTRGLVSGGGKKPWRQKGTGRARAGSSRSPIWVGGGITFGPSKNRNYKTRLPQKMQKAAFNELLALRKADGLIKSVPSLELKEMKTKAALALLKSHQLNQQSVLLVTENIQPELIVATNNLGNVTVITKNELSIVHLIGDTTVVMEEKVYEQYFPKPKPVKKPAQPKAEAKEETN